MSILIKKICSTNNYLKSGQIKLSDFGIQTPDDNNL